MANPNLPYRMVAIAQDKVFSRNMQNAPTPAQIATFAEIMRAQFVTRFYPTKGGWLVTDVRKRCKTFNRFGNGKTVWDVRSLHRFDRVFPSENAAVMWAMIQTGTQITQ
jgi:hypothetical protein